MHLGTVKSKMQIYAHCLGRHLPRKSFEMDPYCLLADKVVRSFASDNFSHCVESLTLLRWYTASGRATKAGGLKLTASLLSYNFVDAAKGCLKASALQ